MLIHGVSKRAIVNTINAQHSVEPCEYRVGSPGLAVQYHYASQRATVTVTRVNVHARFSPLSIGC